jgi:hypothetical protein
MGATSALVGTITLVALSLVVLTVLGPAPARAATTSTAGGGDPGPAAGPLRPQAVAPTTTIAARATSTPLPSATTSPPAPQPQMTSERALGTVSAPPTTRPAAPAAPRPAPPPNPAPPSNPGSNIAPSPNYLAPCEQAGFESAPCLSAAGQATAAARAREGLGALSLPSDFAGLTPGEQQFVLIDIERVDRGLAPVVGMVEALNQDAQSAAAGNADPTPTSVPPGVGVLRWVSNWAQAAGPMGANYQWMYEDGAGSGNLSCTAGGAGGCWGHRDNELGFSSATVASSHGVLVMGAAEATVAGDSPWTSDAVLMALVSGSPAYTYTWAQAQAAGAR